MLGRRLIATAIFVACSSSFAAAQPTGATKPQFVSPCETTAVPESRETLTARQAALERLIARLRADVEKGGPAAAKIAPKSLRDALRKGQEDLLDIMYRLDCLPLTTAEAQIKPRSARAPRPAELVEITTYYATNRGASGNADPMKAYGTDVAQKLSYGRAVVSIPLNHSPGSIELPSLWKLERTSDPNKHFVLKSVTPLDLDPVRKEMRQKMQGMSSKSLLVFVHGYNMGFPEAALRTAQLAHDLKFPGLALFYSWPSAGSVRGYLQDEETSRLSESVFEQLIDEVTQLPVTDIYVIAHSMGNRIVGHALQRRIDKGKPVNHLRELLLAAPDINVDIFRREIAPALATLKDTRTTVYASSSDIALKASRFVHGFKRVGETTEGVFVYPGFDTVDASNVTAALRGYGHSYLTDSPSLLKDIQAIIRQKAAAAARGLSAVGKSPENYWRLVQ